MSHLFTKLNLSKDCLKLGLIDTSDEPACHVGVRLTESRFKDLRVADMREPFVQHLHSNYKRLSHALRKRCVALNNHCVCMSNLFVEPEHGAGHRDVSKTDPLSHQEGASVQMLVQHCKDSLYILLSLLCSLERPRQKNF